MLNKFTSIRSKFIVPLIIILLTLFSVFLLVYIPYQNSSMKKELERGIHFISTMESELLANPVWDINIEQIESIARYAFSEKEVVYIRIYGDEKGAYQLVNLVRDDSGEVISFSKDYNRHSKAIVRKMPIVKDSKKGDKIIGLLEIGFTNSFYLEERNKSILLIITYSLLIFTVVMLAIIFITNIVTAPIRTLTAGMQQILSSSIDDDSFKSRIVETQKKETSVVETKDEIGRLTSVYNKLIDQIIKMFTKLEEEIEERIKVEEKLKEYRDHLEDIVGKRTKELKTTQQQLIVSEKLAGIGQLAAGVAHEINNPTAFVMSNIGILESNIKDLFSIIDSTKQLLEKNLPDDMSKVEEIQTTLESIFHDNNYEFLRKDLPSLVKESLEGTLRIRNIVSSLKNFAHPGEAGFVMLDLNEVVEKSLSICWNEIKYKSEIQKNFSTIPKVKGNETQLEQVFINLFVNAAHAIAQEGVITVDTIYDEKYVKAVVSDNGEGIPEENLSRIFDPFYTSKSVGKGTGLGLSIVYRIIEDHNGTIEVTSKQDEGTIFTIKLPIAS